MFKYPNGNLHGLNLDWFLEQWKKFQNSFTSAFTASYTVETPTTPPSVNVTYDADTGNYDFHFGLPEGVKPSGFEIGYQASASGTTIPTGPWLANPPAVPSGEYLWSRTRVIYNDSQFSQTYAVSRQGVDGAGSPATTNPLMDGITSIGTSGAFARADHIHPSDTSRIPVTDISDLLPLVNSTASAGLSNKVSRADHVHPIDTSRIGVNALANTVPLVDGVAYQGDSSMVARADHVHPTDTTRLPVSALSDSNPYMDGTADPGISPEISRADHVHPSDTTKLDADGIVIERVDLGSRSTNSQGYLEISTSVAKTGYTAIGIVGSYTGTTFVYPVYANISTLNPNEISLCFRDTASGVRTFSPAFDVMYKKN